LGIGDWGLGIGPNPQSPIPNPQSPIPIIMFNIFINNYNINILKNNKSKILYFIYQTVNIILFYQGCKAIPCPISEK